jgi:hypothetical protein
MILLFVTLCALYLYWSTSSGDELPKEDYHTCLSELLPSLFAGMYDGGEHTPKLLPCSHTVCLHCLSRIAASQTRDTGSFRCPICRELITIPRGGVNALPPSFLVNQLLDLMSRQRREVIPKCSVHINQVGAATLRDWNVCSHLGFGLQNSEEAIECKETLISAVSLCVIKSMEVSKSIPWVCVQMQLLILLANSSVCLISFVCQLPCVSTCGVFDILQPAGKCIIAMLLPQLVYFVNVCTSATLIDN